MDDAAMSRMTNMWQVPPMSWALEASDAARFDEQALVNDHGPRESMQPVKRKRGRPPGSLNKATIAKQITELEAGPSNVTLEPQVKRGRGRPRGSRNKANLGLDMFELNGQPPEKRGRRRSKTKSSLNISRVTPSTEDDGFDNSDVEELGTQDGPSLNQQNLYSNGYQLSAPHPKPSSLDQQTIPTVTIDPSLELDNPRPPTPALTPTENEAVGMQVDIRITIDDALFVSLSHGSHLSPPQEPIPDRVLQCLHKSLNLYLKPKPGNDLPRLYSVLRTFWTPQESDVFARGSTDGPPIPPNLRFFLWDPFPLVQNRISCPNGGCNDKLQRAGDTRNALKVIDLYHHYWLVGLSYKCTSCAGHDVPSLWLSWHPSILASLPTPVANEFPLRLFQDKGIDRNLYELIETAYSQGLGGKYISDALQARLKMRADKKPQPALKPPPPSAPPSVPVTPIHEEPEVQVVDHDTHQPTRNDFPTPTVNGEGGSAFSPLLTVGSKISYYPPDPRPPRPSWKQPPIRFSTTPSVAPRATQGSPLLSVQRQLLTVTQADTNQGPLADQIIRTDQPTEENSNAFEQQPKLATSRSNSFEIIESTDLTNETSPSSRSRKPRSCRRCGRVGISVAGPSVQGCAGASDVRHCKNACRDCGGFDCSGRDPKKWKGGGTCSRSQRAGASVANMV